MKNIESYSYILEHIHSDNGTNIMKRFYTPCIGTQKTLEDIKKERMDIYLKHRNNKNNNTASDGKIIQDKEVALMSAVKPKSTPPKPRKSTQDTIKPRINIFKKIPKLIFCLFKKFQFRKLILVFQRKLSEYI